MDGHFVPNLSMEAPIVQALRRMTRLPPETHLTICDPESARGGLRDGQLELGIWEF
jgi:pentose-5-phosphate-3-epimerase